MARIPEEAPWDEGVTFPHFPPLSHSIECDVLIIGGGITGITAAYLLSRENLKVVLVEKDRIGRGATGATTAFLTQYLDTDVADLIQMFGQEKTKIILKSHATAIDAVEHIVQEEKIDCEFTRTANYVYANSEKDTDALRREHEALKVVGIATTLQPARALPFTQAGSLLLPHQAKFHPLRYMAAVVSILKKRGVQLFEETEVKKIQPGSPAIVHTAEQQIKAQHVVVATYAPLEKKLFFKKAFYDSYVLEATIPRESLPEGLYEDTASPYHYSGRRG